ncbi:CpsD/CapB family tyrosine-protein kinase [Thermosediminibacter oceani]|uniref:non-specific protein-tyrosine kinase n=1 Tax=Thermosediminibacter oceani (strain ATCC BAA-1034 / DSM 16646 / JW/IW-1228P) TaxID=555079 RepID=D9S1J9_THEOJ|nr:CpsD/CapB family tyrosine-protein kinase [Thermosediminibacter oceani]ADL07276.1 capsular exopolysaccharide family [Thermosediminibacter oceani DSM 16646]
MEEMDAQLFVMDDPKSVVSEAFRVLRTNLQFSSIDRPLKKVVVTSSIPQEGKSTVIANLAVSIASAGSRVLLVDADLRRPKLYKLFLLENYKGLSNLLAEDLPLDTVVNTTKVENLHVITSGPVPPNPAEVLGSAKMKNFLDEVASLYDMVLIDAPPVNSVADAAILSTLVDGVILVVEEGSTEREAAVAAKQQLDKVNARILGVVLNKVKQQKGGGYYYYYYYYGEGDHKRKKKKIT